MRLMGAMGILVLATQVAWADGRELLLRGGSAVTVGAQRSVAKPSAEPDRAPANRGRGPLEALSGQDARPTGFEGSEAYGGLIGREGSEMHGGYGLGGVGGGLGTTGTIGHGRNLRVGASVSGSDFGERSVRVAKVGVFTVAGALDKDIIRRYVRRNQVKLEHCYEQELATKPALAGPLAVSFTLSGDGLVTAASAKGVDPAVERCVEGVLRTMQLPKSTDGKPVTVAFTITYRKPEADAKPGK